MTLVADASLVLEALTNSGNDGAWARRTLQSDSIVSCHHLPVEVAKVVRRMELAGELESGIATIVHMELASTNVELHSYEPFAVRVWELRHTVTINNAWYVALAEALDVPLATLDRRLARAPGPRCSFLTPPGP